MARKQSEIDICNGLKAKDPAFTGKFGVESCCLFCSGVFFNRKHRFLRKYCSRACYLNHIKSDCTVAANWRGGITHNNGYKYFYVGGDGRPHRAEHIMKAEKALGRPLKSTKLGAANNEVVHHINVDKTDNRNSNLLICTQSYHRWLHCRMGELYAQEKFGRTEAA